MEQTETNLKIPQHVAIIMDGNRRWAKHRGLAQIEGHRVGADCIKPIVEKAIDLGIKSLTFWTFSTENWKRNEDFLKSIMEVFREFLLKKNLFEELKSRGGEVHILGDPSKFPSDIQNKLSKYLKDNRPLSKVIDVNFALNYGGREEILQAVRRLIADGKKAIEVTADLFNSYLYTAGQADVDFIIRTGGEKRLSGYLPWQAVYAELYFTDIYWPDFAPADFEAALLEYTKRERRLGGDSPSLPESI